jgi:hypothetical protein
MQSERENETFVERLLDLGCCKHVFCLARRFVRAFVTATLRVKHRMARLQ